MAVLTVDAMSRTFSSASGAASTSSYVPPVAGSQDYVWVEILDSNLVSKGPVQFVNLNAKLYYNAVGSWSMLVPYTDALWDIMMAGDFFVSINWRGLFTFGGKCEKPGYQSSIPGMGSGQQGPFISLSGADYLALIANRIVFPNPAVAWASQTAGASDAVSGARLETAIKHYVNNNVGPGALTARRITSMTIGPDLARGPTISYSAKFAGGITLNLLDVIRNLLANANIAMGVTVTRNAPARTLVFDVYIPRDLRNKMWFSESLGNLSSINFSLSDGTCTDAYTYGQGAFISRVATAGSTQYSKVEQYIDSSSEPDTSNLGALAQQAIFAGAIGPIMDITSADTPFMTFGRDYGLGDIVSVEVRPGDVFTDVVSSVELTADPSQNPPMSVVPTLGHSSQATDTDQTIIGQLTARIRVLESKLSTK